MTASKHLRVVGLALHAPQGLRIIALLPEATVACRALVAEPLRCLQAIGSSLPAVSPCRKDRVREGDEGGRGQRDSVGDPGHRSAAVLDAIRMALTIRSRPDRSAGSQIPMRLSWLE
jgi:hypothetical protein